MASEASRNESDGRLTEGAKVALEDIARILRLTHMLFWCLVVKRYNCILSPEGLSYLRMKLFMNQEEYASMVEVSKKNLGAHHACLTWLSTRINIAVKRGDIVADQSAMTNIHLKMHELRRLLAKIVAMYSGRMHLSYVHMVNMLIDVLICLSPLALFPLCYFWLVPAVGTFTFFYKGIFELSMMFLDPVDNDKRHQKKGIETAGIDIGVLIRETDASSLRFTECAAALPQY
jgi:hypothetical protein